MAHGNALLTQAELNHRMQMEEEARKEEEARSLRELHEAYEQKLEDELRRLEVTGSL